MKSARSGTERGGREETELEEPSDPGFPASRALVLAAGRGRRLDGEKPKPLYELLGLSLLMRTLLTLERGGATDAHVVVGHEADRIRSAVEEEADRVDLRIHWVHNDRWRRSNGLSVLAAEGELSRPFFLTMCDHVFPVEFLTRLRAAGVETPGSGGEDVAGDGVALRLVVDRDVEEIAGPEDATKVDLEGDRIRDIGKDVDPFDAVDTGVFLTSPALFTALRQAADEEGDVTLSHGVRWLAERGRARTVDGSGLLWHDVDTREDAERAERKLLDSMRKETDGPVARRINRPISLALSRWLVGTPVTPNQVSVAAMLVSFGAAVLAARGGYLPWLAAGGLFQLASIVDGTDGEVAKLTFQDSHWGEWVDTVCDNLSYLAFVVGVIVGVARSDLSDLYLWAGGVGGVATLASFANIHLYLLREGESGSALDVRYDYEEGDDLHSRVIRSFHHLGKRDVFSLLVLLLAVAGQIPAGLLIFGAATTILLFPATLRANLRSRQRHLGGPDGTPSPRGWTEGADRR